MRLLNSSVVLVANLLAAALIQVAPEPDAARDALNLGRTHDQALYDAFSAGYRLTPSGVVDSVEVITEFRRAVLIVRERALQGEYSFTANDLASALTPYRGLVTFIAQVRLHPLNTYAGPPEYRSLRANRTSIEAGGRAKNQARSGLSSWDDGTRQCNDWDPSRSLIPPRRHRRRARTDSGRE